MHLMRIGYGKHIYLVYKGNEFFYPGPSKGVRGLTPGCIPYTWNAIRGKSPYTID